MTIQGLDRLLLARLKRKFTEMGEKEYYNSYPARTGETGITGENPTAGVPDGYIWTRASFVNDAANSETVSRAAVPAINLVNSSVTNAPVRCGFTSPNFGGELVAYAVRASNETVTQYGNYLGALGTPVAPAELDTQPVATSRLLDGLVTKSKSGSLNIAIQPFGAFPGLDPFDVSASIPSTAAARRWVIVSVNEALNTGLPADSVTLTNGAESGVPKALFALTRLDAETIQVPAGDTRLAAVLLEHGQIVIDDTTVILDLRTHYGVTGMLLSEAPETLTIAAGVAVADGNSYFLIESESGTADDLDTLTVTGVQRVILLQADPGDTITVKTGTGNIFLNGGIDFAVSGDKTLALFWDGTNLSDVSPPASGGGGGGTATLLLNYAANTDLFSGTSISATTWTDVNTNQSFTVTNGSVIIEFVVICNMIIGAGASMSIALRLVIDSAGTPAYEPLEGGRAPLGDYGSAPGGTVKVSSLSAAVHTVKIQVQTTSAATADLRANTVPDFENLTIQVTQFG